MNELSKQDPPALPAAAPNFLAPQSSAIAAIQQNKEVAATLASIFIAKQFPRDMAKITHAVRLNCSRPSFARAATYAYPRGKGEARTTITGASIRLAESLLAAYGNAEAGWRVLSVSYDLGKACAVSHCEAYCFDKENNITNTIRFDVKHWRDTKSGGYALTDERDVYELCANQANRRKRKCILETLPAWLVEEALEACNTTLEQDNAGTPLEDLLRRAEAAFAAIGVTRRQLEQHLGHNWQSTVKGELILLNKNLNALREGNVRVGDIFPPAEQEETAPAEPTAPEIPAGKAATAATNAAPQFGTTV